MICDCPDCRASRGRRDDDAHAAFLVAVTLLLMLWLLGIL